MDFLKSAVASAISKGPAFPYSFGDRVDIDQSIWTLHNGTKREDGSRCSILSFDITANRNRLPLAKNALRKLRTIRHPGVVKVLDTVETDTYIYIATERITPLGWQTRRKSLAEETLKWGLHSIAKTLKFINEEASSVHGLVRVSSIFTSESGEWKLGGFDILSSVKEDEAIIYTHGSLAPDSGRYAPPEISKSGWEAIKRNPIHAVDAYNFGILISEAFNGSFTGAEQTPQTTGIPPSMHQSYKRLVNASPKVRLSVGQFLDQGHRNGGFFQTPLIQITEDIENLGLKEDNERDEFLSRLDDLSDDFPEEFFKMKVLPELLKSVEFAGGGPKVFNVVMKIGSKLTDEEYDSQITPVIIRLFTNPDRAIRVCLLDNLPLMIDHLSQKIVTDKIFPQMVTGFTDVAPLLREQTVKAVLTVVPKLSDRIINGELLRYLAKTANDEQPGIRTNTTICLGKLARNLAASSRAKVLTAAFSRSLRDPFVHARHAALLALAATVELYSEDDCASKLLPAICPSLTDKEKLVRDQANKCTDVYLQRIRKYQETLPETLLQTPSTTSATATAPRIGAQNESSWAGWAISSFTNKLASATGEISSGGTNGTATQDQQRSSSVPPSTSSTTSNQLSLNSKPTTVNKAPKQSNLLTTSSTLNTPLTSTSAAGDDFDDDAWGGGFDETSNNDEENDIDPFAPTPSSATTHSAAFDDKGEPDFAGWLAAQTQSKQKIKPLPKGLSKSATRPAVGVKSNSTGLLAGRTTTTTSTVKKAMPVRKKVEEVKKKVEDDEDWGDAWN